MRERPRHSVRLFAWMAHRLLPEDFRRQVGAPLVEAFDDAMGETKGVRDRALLLLRELASLLATAAGERWRKIREVKSPNRSGSSLLASVLSDLHLGARGLLRRKSFGFLAVSALAFGIGLNAALFGLADAVFLKPLPYPDAGRLALVSMELAPTADDSFSASYLDLRDLREQNRSFDSLALFLDWQSVNLSGGESPERVAVSFATADYFELLGFEALLGRVFREEEALLGSPHPVAVLSYATWQRSFGGDEEVVGRTVLMNGWPFEVVGVLSPGTDLGERFRESTGLYLPLFWARELSQLDIDSRRSARYLFGLARLRPSVSLAEARQDLGEISRRLERSYPDTNEGWRFLIRPLAEVILGDVRQSTAILLSGAALVLLLVCANLASLLLIQGGTRRKELAMRRALGAGAGRLVRQLATESFLLAALGGILGSLLAHALLKSIQGHEAFPLPSFVSLGLDARLLAASLGITVATALLFGIVPAVKAARCDLLSGLKGAASAHPFASSRGPAPLVAAEVALAVILLAGASLMLESFARLRGAAWGFDTERLLTAKLDLRDARYDDPEARRSLARRISEEAESLPGVAAAFVWSPSAIGGGNWVRFMTREGRYERADERIQASRHHVHAGALRKLGIPLLAGRDFAASDREGSPPVAIVSQALGRALWPGEDPLGRRLDASRGREIVTYEVVGVAGDARHRSRVDRPTGSLDAEYDLYLPFEQEPERYLNLLLRLREGVDRAGLAAPLRGVVARADEHLPVYDLAPMEERIDREEAPIQFSSLLATLYAGVALAIAAIGIYGAASQSVKLRTREIGIRMAVGARATDVIREVVGDGMKWVAAGALVGLLGTRLASALLASRLYGVGEPGVSRLLAVAAILTLVALAASSVPVREASRVDPTRALRQE